MEKNDTVHTGTVRQSLGLGLAALGVVYGDIGTSPLYGLDKTAREGRLLPMTIPA